MKNKLLAFLSLFLICISCVKNSEKNVDQTEELAFYLPEKVDFNFHIKPILSDRCFTCHGPDAEQREANLALHTQEGLFQKSQDDPKQFIVLAGQPDASVLYQRLIDTDPSIIMPPPESNLNLSDQEIALLRRWIEQGAEWKKHWAFIPPKPIDLPAAAKQIGKNEIDYFIQKALPPSLSPSPPASPERLLRRLSLDIRGIPPSLDEIEAFQKDPSDLAYERKIDEYLSSVDHAEQMTAWWLDIARYADTHGYQDDLEREMWPWRDWVIHAFQENMPYDQFVTWQLAGDLLPDADLEMILATGFNRNHKITQEGGALPEEFLVEYVSDRAITTFTAFQGITMECARCHDHKYDPISQKNFFEVYDFFNRVPEKGLVDYGEHPQPLLALDRKQIDGVLDFINAVDSILPIHPMVMKEQPGIRQTHLLNRGQYDQPGEVVSCATPESILPFAETYDQDRLGLSKWLFDAQNPLTARIIANRIWQRYQGQGIVKTLDDFGNQGALPTHPELLDWLAIFLMENGWNLQTLEKKILLSATYRQDSKIDEKALELDPDNVYLARASRYRLSAEIIRDQALHVSGLLVNEVGGPPVKPYQPKGLWAEKTSGGGYTTYKQDKGQKLYRKSLYTYWKRTVPPPTMLLFDAPTRDVCTVKRQRTSTPLQALALLNDPQQLEAARVMAGKVLAETKEVNPAIHRAFYLTTARAPSPKEMSLLEEYFTTEQQRFAQDAAAQDSLLQIGDFGTALWQDKSQWAAMTMVASTLLNMDETISRQ